MAGGRVWRPLILAAVQIALWEKEMNTMRWIAASSVASLVLMAASATAGPAIPPEPLMVHDTCSVCHGHTGISPNTSFPNLAGQTKTYLKTELKDFQSHQRADRDAVAYMWSMARSLSDKKIDTIANYYSALTPPMGSGDGSSAEAAAGGKIFTQGIASVDVPACESCHGANAAGNDTFPRLAGQHREYLVAQLRAFRSGARNDPTMHFVTQNMTDAQIRDVTAYLASL